MPRALFCMCSVLLFVTFGCGALFVMYTVDFLSRQCLVHCLVCVLLTVCYVSAPRNVLHLFC